MKSVLSLAPMNADRVKEQEADLVDGLKQGRTESLKKIYQSYYPVISSLVLRNNGSEFEAKDIFQESVILLYEKLQQPEFRLTCSIKTFIYAVSKRLWLKKWNEQKVKIYDTPDKFGTTGHGPIDEQLCRS
jgi:DNA-directed RNA polymerase specialized sigma24 family protein